MRGRDPPSIEELGEWVDSSVHSVCLFGFCLFVCFLFFVLFWFGFWDRVSLYSSGCPRTHFVDQAGLELRNPPASASLVLGLKVCSTMPCLLELLSLRLHLCSAEVHAAMLGPNLPSSKLTSLNVFITEIWDIDSVVPHSFLSHHSTWACRASTTEPLWQPFLFPSLWHRIHLPELRADEIIGLYHYIQPDP